MSSPLLQNITADVKAIEAKILPVGIGSTKFIAIAVAVIAGIVLLKGNMDGILHLIEWGVNLYVIQRLVEGGYHYICDTVLKNTAMKLAAQEHMAAIAAESSKN